MANKIPGDEGFKQMTLLNYATPVSYVFGYMGGQCAIFRSLSWPISQSSTSVNAS